MVLVPGFSFPSSAGFRGKSDFSFGKVVVVLVSILPKRRGWCISASFDLLNSECFFLDKEGEFTKTGDFHKAEFSLYLRKNRGRELNTNFFFSNFSGTPGDIPAKSRDIPPKMFDFPGFEGHTELFWPPPLHVEDSYPTGKHLGHTPSTAGTFRKKFRKNSGKTPETLSERFLEFPSRVRLGCPKPYNSRHLRLPERFQNSLPPQYG